MTIHEQLQSKYATLRPVLDERALRLWAAAEAQAHGRGGMTLVAAATPTCADSAQLRIPRVRIGRQRQQVVRRHLELFTKFRQRRQMHPVRSADQAIDIVRAKAGQRGELRHGQPVLLHDLQ